MRENDGSSRDIQTQDDDDTGPNVSPSVLSFDIVDEKQLVLFCLSLESSIYRHDQATKRTRS